MTKPAVRTLVDNATVDGQQDSGVVAATPWATFTRSGGMIKISTPVTATLSGDTSTHSVILSAVMSHSCP